MGYTKEKKAKLFLRVGGKCEYCGCDMVLCFADKYNQDNLATFDHLYNRDHELRQSENNDHEKRIFLVCKKCNCSKSQKEPNNNEKNGIDKTVKKIVPKEAWSNDKFVQRIREVVSDEFHLAIEISKIDKQMNHLNSEKSILRNKLSKKAKYRNLITQHFRDKLNSEQSVQVSDTTEAD